MNQIPATRSGINNPFLTSKGELITGQEVGNVAMKRFEALKEASMQLAKSCHAVVISDETTLAMATQTLAKAKDHLNAIDKKREELKKPYWEAGKTIDRIAKEVSADLEEAINAGRAKLSAWNTQQIELQRKEQERIAKIQTFLESIGKQIQQKVNMCRTMEDCINLSKSIKEKFPDPAKTTPFEKEAEEILKLSLSQLKSKYLAFKAQQDDGQTAAEAAEQEAAAKKAAEAANAEIAQKAQDQQEATKAAAPTSAMRHTWKFRIVDATIVPEEFMVVNEAKVKEFMKANKEKLGTTTIPGIEFYKEMAPILR